MVFGNDFFALSNPALLSALSKKSFPMQVALSWRAGSSNQRVGYLDHYQTLVQIDPQAVASNPRFDWRENMFRGYFR